MTHTLVVPPIMLAWAAKDPTLQPIDLMWRMHEHLADVDRAREQLGPVGVDEFSDLLDSWTGAHLARYSGWGRDLVACRRDVAARLLQTHLTADRLAELLGTTPLELARHVTAADTAAKWLEFDAVAVAGGTRAAAREAAGVRRRVAARWAALRPWTAAATDNDTPARDTPVMDIWIDYFNAGLMPSEAWRARLEHDPDALLDQAQNAYTHWQRTTGAEAAERHRQSECAQCGVTFRRLVPQQRFCSRRCSWTEANARATARARAEAPKRHCPCCGTEVVGKLTKVFCGDSCRLKHRKKSSVTAQGSLMAATDQVAS